MKKFNIFLLMSFCLIILLALSDQFGTTGLNKYKQAPVRASKSIEDYQTTFIDSYDSNSSEPSLESLQCPIPKKDRVKNYTGIQCVYSSIEMLGRWAKEPKLINPPITSRSDCQGYSSPSKAEKILKELDVKFEQSYGDRENGIKLLKKAMKEGRGALWGVPGHAMVIVHYSEEENRVCWVDNSDRELRVQKTTINNFNKRWNSWILVIYPDNDMILNIRLNRKIPIWNQDKNRPEDKIIIPIPDTYLSI